MSASNPSTPATLPASDGAAHVACTLHICTSCRSPGTPREPRTSRPGFVLYKQVRDALEASSLRHRVKLKPAECLSVCPRACGIALSWPGAWTYLFGDQGPNATVDDIMKCVALFIESPDGYMARDARPKSLQASILGRVPPVRGA